MRVAGIDPGTRVVGYGIVETQGNAIRPVAFGVVRPKLSLPYEQRLAAIFEGLRDILDRHSPEVAAIEEAFYGQSITSAFRMGEGRGVAIVAASIGNRPLFQYTPAEVKKAVVGNGRAHKSQVQEMVRVLLGMAEVPEPEDAADALAVAICHCNRLAGDVMALVR